MIWIPSTALSVSKLLKTPLSYWSIYTRKTRGGNIDNRKKKKPTLYLLVYQDKKMATSYHKIQEMSAECREIESTQRNQNWEKKWLMWKISGEDSGEKCGIYDWYQENWFQEISGSIYHPLSLISSLERLLEAELWYKKYKSHDYLVIKCKVGLIFFFMFSPFKNIYWWTWINLTAKKSIKIVQWFLNTVNIMVCC